MPKLQPKFAVFDAPTPPARFACRQWHRHMHAQTHACTDTQTHTHAPSCALVRLRVPTGLCRAGKWCAPCSHGCTRMVTHAMYLDRYTGCSYTSRFVTWTSALHGHRFVRHKFHRVMLSCRPHSAFGCPRACAFGCPCACAFGCPCARAVRHVAKRKGTGH